MAAMAAARIRIELQKYLTDPEYRVFPHLPFPFERIEPASTSEMPPLLKGYLRIGARICGEPAWDPDFNTADFLVWLSLGQPASALRAPLRTARGAGRRGREGVAARLTSCRAPQRRRTAITPDTSRSSAADARDVGRAPGLRP